MRILIVTNLFDPDRGGGASVITDLALGLVDTGSDVVVQTAYPYYPEWRDKSGRNGIRIDVEQNGALIINRHGMYIPSSPAKVQQRVVQEISFFLSLCRGIVSLGQFDVVIAYCPLISCLGYAAVRKAVRGERILLNVQDIPAEAASAGNILSGGIRSRLAKWVQRFLFERANQTCTIAPGMVDQVQNIVRRSVQVEYFPNFLHRSMEVSIEKFAHMRGDFRSAVPVPGTLRMLYAGNIGRKPNLIEFCERIASDTSLAFQLSIFGAGSEAGAVRDWIARSCDGRFSFEDFLPEDRFVQELLLAEVFVITEVEDAGSSFIPSKLIPAICAGTPILAVSGARSPLAVEVSDYDLGVVTPWSDAGTGVDTIRRLVHDPVQRAALALSLSGRARAYGREAAIQRMATMLSDLTGKN